MFFGISNYLLFQDWLSVAHSLVEDRHAVASSFVEKVIRTMMSKYINAVGRFDLESLKLDLAAYMAARREIEAAANALANMQVG